MTGHLTWWLKRFRDLLVEITKVSMIDERIMPRRETEQEDLGCLSLSQRLDLSEAERNSKEITLIMYIP